MERSCRVVSYPRAHARSVQRHHLPARALGRHLAVAVLVHRVARIFRARVHPRVSVVAVAPVPPVAVRIRIERVHGRARVTGRVRARRLHRRVVHLSRAVRLRRIRAAEERSEEGDYHGL